VVLDESGKLYSDIFRPAFPLAGLARLILEFQVLGSNIPLTCPIAALVRP
jgi:hypothetical protein